VRRVRVKMLACPRAFTSVYVLAICSPALRIPQRMRGPARHRGYFLGRRVISVLASKVSGLKNPVANCVLVFDYNLHHQQNFQMHAGNLSNLAPFRSFFSFSV